MSKSTVHDLSKYRAEQLVEDGKHQISIGELDAALLTFEKSNSFYENSEAYTYLAWVQSLKGFTDKAIELCKKAIELDPDFGNPLNDLGSYLIQKNQLDEAIPWLEKAKEAKRYEVKHFPHMNLGRIYSAQGKISQAIDEFRKALQYTPGHNEIQKVLAHLENLKNNQINA